MKKADEEILQTTNIVKKKLMRFHVGDLVQIPNKYIEFGDDKFIIARVHEIHDQYICFEYAYGLKTCIAGMDCLKFPIVEKASARSDSDCMFLEDILQSME